MSPQTANQGLKFAGFPPINPLPTIKNIVEQAVPQKESPKVEQSVAATEEVKDVEKTIPQEENAQNEVTPEVLPEQVSEEKVEDFSDCWLKVIDKIFTKQPAFYHQLRNNLPRFENDIVYVGVENEFQKNKLESFKRAMVEFWRENFKLNIDDIIFEIQEHEKTKVIYTNEDKVENMMEQNPELKNFLQILNFRIKDL